MKLIVNLKRAIRLSILLYIVSFIVGIGTGVLLGVDFSTATEAPTSVWIVGLFTSVIITGLFTWWYFAKEQATLKHGFQFGLTVIVVSFILDGILIVPAIVASDAPQSIAAYYTNPFFWLVVALVIGTATLVGRWKEKLQL